jgi:hypothetical protein
MKKKNYPLLIAETESEINIKLNKDICQTLIIN